MDPITAGQKRQTIRKRRENPICPGETLRLYTVISAKDCRLLAEVQCVSVEPIEICPEHIAVNGRALSMAERQHLAQADGFDNLARFYDFFAEQDGLPFSGVLIRWSAPNQQVPPTECGG